MATAFTISQIHGTSGMQWADHDPTKKPGRGTLQLRKVVLDFDAIASATGVALAHSDTYQAMHVSAGETIIAAGVNILTAATAAATIDVGFTGGDVDMLVDGVAANDATLPTATRGILVPVYIPSADTIDVLESSGAQTLAGCVAEVWILVAKI